MALTRNPRGSQHGVRVVCLAEPIAGKQDATEYISGRHGVSLQRVGIHGTDCQPRVGQATRNGHL